MVRLASPGEMAPEVALPVVGREWNRLSSARRGSLPCNVRTGRGGPEFFGVVEGRLRARQVEAECAGSGRATGELAIGTASPFTGTPRVIWTCRKESPLAAKRNNVRSDVACSVTK